MDRGFEIRPEPDGGEVDPAGDVRMVRTGHRFRGGLSARQQRRCLRGSDAEGDQVQLGQAGWVLRPERSCRYREELTDRLAANFHDLSPRAAGWSISHTGALASRVANFRFRRHHLQK